MNKATFYKVSGEMAEYIQRSQEIITNLRDENEGLRKHASQEKVASGSPALDTDGVENMVDHVIEAGLLKEAQRQEAIDAMSADPNSLVTFVDQLATKSLEKTATAAPSLGRPYKQEKQSSAASVRESDQAYDKLCRSLRSRV
jgi:ABC-type transporter MlaC component